MLFYGSVALLHSDDGVASRGIAMISGSRMSLVPSLAHCEAVHACHGCGYEISDSVALLGHYSGTTHFAPPLLVVVHHMLDEISEMVVISLLLDHLCYKSSLGSS